MSAIAVWDVFRIAGMSQEQRIRNLCRQIEQSVCQFGRRESVCGIPIRRGEQFTGNKRVSILTGGDYGKQWARVDIDGAAVYENPTPIIPGAAAELYLLVMDAIGIVDSHYIV